MAVQGRRRSPRFARIPGVDPYVDWALGPGRSSFFPGDRPRWFTILLLLADITPQDFQDGRGFIDPADLAEWKAAVRVAKLYEPARSAQRTTFVTALVTERFFLFLDQNKTLRKHVVRFTLGRPVEDESRAPTVDEKRDGLR